MKPDLETQALLTAYTPKGWYISRMCDTKLDDDDVEFSAEIRDANHCDYCGTRIRYAFVIKHYDAPSSVFLLVGCECVRSFVDEESAAEAVSFLRHKWRQHRHYFWKRYRGGVVVVGAKRGVWWAARGDRLLEHGTWTFCGPRFSSASEARHYLTQSVVLGQEVAPRPAPAKPPLSIAAFVQRFHQRHA